MALTQVFDYMVNYGIAYGYVAAGQSLVFLYIDRANPQTLYYHLCVPAEDVGKASAGDVADKASHTAVAQLASFCLLSLRSEALEGVSLDAALQKAKMTLRKWREPYEDTALEAEGSDSTSTSASASQESQESNESNFTSKAAPASRELSLRSKSCKPAAVLRRDEDEDEDEEDRPDGNQSSTWTRAGLH
ncbi:hypothetical protein TOPH_02900 [Tolypocladium ophioglossoides CBS 100239]|uniref:Uncharacterized protein n=1 Tax=Tolypocladium ophioglossoides (strain CBS 100239) TaxID=1163406 RepID=A0A0L0NFW9_TOLOC|nr:hypothetical protein TOPH_02900 [Tolypocladium ophioglossoides CBS 100239]